MKILVLGNEDSIWVKYFIEYVLSHTENEIYIFSNTGKPQFDAVYSDYGVKYIVGKEGNTILRKIPKIRQVYKTHITRKTLKGSCFDKAVVISVTPEALLCAKSAVKADSAIYAYFTGSDIIRIRGIRFCLLSLLMSITRPYVVCGSSNVKATLCEKIKGKYDETPIIRFGIPQIEEIRKQKHAGIGIEECKRHFGIPEETVSVFIGYNASPAQQHLPVLEALDNLPNQVKKNISVVMPMAYCVDSSYLEQIRSYIDKSTLDCIILDKFLDTHETAMLRLATDVFINAQKTDSLSASVLESYYAGGRVLSGKWLKYPDLNENGIYYEEFEDFHELQVIITDLLKKGEPVRELHRDCVHEILSPESFRKAWGKILFK